MIDQLPMIGWMLIGGIAIALLLYGGFGSRVSVNDAFPDGGDDDGGTTVAAKRPSAEVDGL